ncbi:hypothetical protein M2112_000832, partial [Aurantimicrobium minutum]|nr:hypothetical protein [Aurantimicrobium minutum]
MNSGKASQCGYQLTFKFFFILLGMGNLRLSAHKRAIFASLLSFVMLFASLTFFDTAKSQAADLSQFNAGNIISDAIFYDGTAMSASDVQSFLNSKVPTCTINNGQASHAAGAPYGSTTISDVCLKDYRQTTPSMAAQPGICAAYSGSPSESAASIIAKVGAACNINQKVLLVLLEKEQSLISDSWPTVRQISQATGFACYDNGQPCVQDYAGFFYQIWSAARQFQRYGTAPFTWYPVGQTSNILYQANMPECGTKAVYIQNRATAALYYYTPYTPNDAALAAGYGRGDACSAYGNRNFYQLFVDWFGSTQNPRALIAGAWETLTGTPGSINVSGWVLVRSNPTTASNLIFSIDGVRQTAITASQSNPASEAAIPGSGTNHGFTASFPASAGSHRICGFPQIIPSGEAEWGCTYVTVPAAPPIAGAWESLSGSAGQINTSGWLLYPANQSGTASVVFTVDGVRTSAFTANQSNGGSASAYPAAGTNHGFTASIPASPGTHRICGWPQLATGGDHEWGCTYVTVPNTPRIAGAWESLSGSAGQINTSGWLLYPANQSGTAS